MRVTCPACQSVFDYPEELRGIGSGNVGPWAQEAERAQDTIATRMCQLAIGYRDSPLSATYSVRLAYRQLVRVAHPDEVRDDDPATPGEVGPDVPPEVAGCRVARSWQAESPPCGQAWAGKSLENVDKSLILR